MITAARAGPTTRAATAGQTGPTGPTGPADTPIATRRRRQQRRHRRGPHRAADRRHRHAGRHDRQREHHRQQAGHRDHGQDRARRRRARASPATTLRLGIAKLVPAGDGLPSRWQSYVNRAGTPSIPTPVLASAIQANTESGVAAGWRNSARAISLHFGRRPHARSRRRSPCLRTEPDAPLSIAIDLSGSRTSPRCPDNPFTWISCRPAAPSRRARRSRRPRIAPRATCASPSTAARVAASSTASSATTRRRPTRTPASPSTWPTWRIRSTAARPARSLTSSTDSTARSSISPKSPIRSRSLLRDLPRAVGRRAAGRRLERHSRAPPPAAAATTPACKRRARARRRAATPTRYTHSTPRVPPDFVAQDGDCHGCHGAGKVRGRRPRAAQARRGPQGNRERQPLHVQDPQRRERRRRPVAQGHVPDPRRERRAGERQGRSRPGRLRLDFAWSTQDIHNVADVAGDQYAADRGEAIVVDLIAEIASMTASSTTATARSATRWHSHCRPGLPTPTLGTGPDGRARRPARDAGRLRGASGQRFPLRGRRRAHDARRAGEVRDLPQARGGPRRQPRRRPADLHGLPQFESGRHVRDRRRRCRWRSARSSTACTRARSAVDSHLSAEPRAVAKAVTSPARSTSRARAHLPMTVDAGTTEESGAATLRLDRTTSRIPRRRAPARVATIRARRSRTCSSRAAVRAAEDADAVVLQSKVRGLPRRPDDAGPLRDCRSAVHE